MTAPGLAGLSTYVWEESRELPDSCAGAALEGFGEGVEGGDEGLASRAANSSAASTFGRIEPSASSESSWVASSTPSSRISSWFDLR